MQRNAVRLSALAVLVAASGCIVVAKPVTREVFVRIDESQPTEVGGGVGWEITTRIEADMANVVVTAARVQACTRVRSEVYDELETETPEASWLFSGGVSAPHGGRLDPWDDAVGVAMIGLAAATVVFLPVTVGSAIVAEITSTAHHDTKTRKTRSLETIPSICPHVVATAPVELTLPSGAVLTGTTGSDGRVSFAIPEGEPDSGTAITRVADQTQSATFFKTTETCERARTEIFARVVGATAVEQRWQLLRALPTACGDPLARAWSLTATAALDALGSRCDSIKSFAGQVQAIDRELYNTVFTSEPDIAQCLDDPTGALRRRAACIEQRSAAIPSAQHGDDIKERTRVLASLPDCDAPGAREAARSRNPKAEAAERDRQEDCQRLNGRPCKAPEANRAPARTR